MYLYALNKYLKFILFINSQKLRYRTAKSKKLQNQIKKLREEIEKISMTCPFCEIDMVKILNTRIDGLLWFRCLRCKHEHSKVIE